MRGDVSSQSTAARSNTAFKPRKKRGLRVLGTDHEGKVVFLDPLAPTWTSLNTSQSLLLSLCDGHRSVEDIARTFRSTDLGTNPVERVRDLVGYLERAGMLEGPEEPYEPGAPLKPLSTVSVYATRACNLRCKYCFFSAGRPHAREMNTGEMLALLEEMTNIGAVGLYVLGGEPLLRGDIFEILKRSVEKGMVVKLLTNGTLIDDKIARKLSEIGCSVQLSLDGLQKENDLFRGEGSFHAAVNGIKALLHHEVDLTVSSVLSRVNVGSLDDFLDYLANVGVKAFHCVQLQCWGRGKAAPGTRLGTKEFLEVLIGIWSRWNEAMKMPQALDALTPRKHHRKVRCGAGNGMVEVDPIGRVYPCYKYMQSRFCAGNVRDNSLSDIYTRSPAMAEIRSLTVPDDPVCNECDFKFMCGFYCMAEPREEGPCEYYEVNRWILTEAQGVDIDQERVMGHT